MIFKYAYCLALLHPISLGLGLWMGGAWIYCTVILSAVIYPILEILIKPFSHTDRVAVISATPEIISKITAVTIIAITISTVAFIPNSTFTPQEKMVLTYSCGLTMGIIGIVLAHELFHRRSALDRSLGTTIMFLANYPHFKLQHLYSHHPNVATEDDNSSARHGQTLYGFFIQSIFMGGLSLWKKECTRSLLRSNYRYHPIHNRVITLWGGQVILYSIILFLLGPFALAIFITQGIASILILETVNYIQHYGLKRSIHTRPGHKDSWDNYSFSNFVLFNLGYHSDHHVNPTKPFYSLSQQSTAPTMPFGYFTMSAVALIPPLWRWMMDNRHISNTNSKNI